MAPVNVIYVDDLRGGYTRIAREVLTKGEETSPRGMKTWELVAPTIVLSDPTDALPLGIGRKPSLKIAAVEAAQLLAGQGAPELVLASSPNFGSYTEPDGSFWGNYGDRMNLQLLAVYERLRQDPASRQAVITLWKPEKDLYQDGKRDYPCTVGFQFLVRDGKLVMITTMRSNDVWKGLAYDVFQFTQLQINLAGLLGVEVGSYVHRPGSLHVYGEDEEKVRELSEVATRGPIEEVRVPVCVEGASSETVIHGFRRLLQSTLDPTPEASPALHWYNEQLGKLRG